MKPSGGRGGTRLAGVPHIRNALKLGLSTTLGLFGPHGGFVVSEGGFSLVMVASWRFGWHRIPCG
jgi:hypothetical protein